MGNYQLGLFAASLGGQRGKRSITNTGRTFLALGTKSVLLTWESIK